MTPVETDGRDDGTKIPGRVTKCARCQRLIVWGRTVPSETSPGGKPMPLDPVSHHLGNLAVPKHLTNGNLPIRPLKADETHVQGHELRAMPHFATCAAIAPLPDQLPDNVIDFADRRRAKGARR